MPGTLKNAIGWVSRAPPQPFDERHGLLVSASQSMVGGNRGRWSPRVPLDPCVKRAWVEFLGERPGPDADRVDT